MKKTYLCYHRPALRMNRGVKFVNGIFETDLPAQQTEIEKSDSFGCFITLLPVSLAKVSDSIDETLAAEDVLPTAPPEDALCLAEDTKWTATKVNEMRKNQLQAVAEELEISPAQTVTKLRREIKHALGV